MDRFTYMSDKENPRNIDILRESAEAARDAGVLCYIIDKALKVGTLEDEENVDCPAIIAYAECLKTIAAGGKEGQLAFIELEYILDIRGQYFANGRDMSKVIRSYR